MKTNNTHNIDFEEIIYIILLILSIIAFIFLVKDIMEYFEESIPKESRPKSTYINTSPLVIDSHEESESETIEYINQTPNEYTITYGCFDPDIKQPNLTTRTITHSSN